MASRRKPLELSRGRPAGPRWSEYCRVLRVGWARAGRRCFYCDHPMAAAHLIEVCHLISPLVRLDLAWDRGNLVPGHGPSKRTGDKRCPVCDLNCNWLAHNAPDAPKDPVTGADLPFTPEFMARATAERAAYLRRTPRKPVTVRETPPEPRKPVVPFRSVSEQAGRPWLSARNRMPLGVDFRELLAGRIGIDGDAQALQDFRGHALAAQQP